MSAAATAAGYLYASGRLRGREKREPEADKPESTHEQKSARPKIERPRVEEPVRVAAVPAREDTRPRRTPTIQYRVRRWKPEPQHEE